MRNNGSSNMDKKYTNQSYSQQFSSSSLHNVDMEINILSTILSNREALQETMAHLKTTDFYFTAHQIIFRAIVKLFNEGLTLEFSLLNSTLQDQGLWELCSSVLPAITGADPTDNYLELLNGIKELSINRNNISELVLLEHNTHSSSIAKNDTNAHLEESSESMPLNNSSKLSIISYCDLMSMDFQEPSWVIPGIIPEGVTIIAGAPKLGKSWLALDLCLSLSFGGTVLGRKVEKIHTLYLALEDTNRRLKSRIKKQFSGDMIDPFTLSNQGCLFATRWENGDEGLLKLYNFIKDNNIKVVCIDTMGRFSSVRDGNDYIQQTRFMASVKSLSDDLNVSIILIHHTRKGTEDPDFINNIIGSIGITGGADNIIVMTRKRNNTDGILKLTSRDTEEADYGIRFDPVTCRWDIIGSAAELTESNEREEILEILKSADNQMSSKEIDDILGKKPNTVTYLLTKMTEAGNIIKIGYGKYSALPERSAQTPQSPHTENKDYQDNFKYY